MRHRWRHYPPRSSLVGASSGLFKQLTDVFPVSNINKVLNLTLSNCYVDLHGFLKYSDDIQYWIHNAWSIPALQNQSLGLSFLGNDFVLDGNNVGGVDGNGQVWYTYSRGVGNVPGR